MTYQIQSSFEKNFFYEYENSNLKISLSICDSVVVCVTLTLVALPILRLSPISWSPGLPKQNYGYEIIKHDFVIDIVKTNNVLWCHPVLAGSKSGSRIQIKPITSSRTRRYD